MSTTGYIWDEWPDEDQSHGALIPHPPPRNSKSSRSSPSLTRFEENRRFLSQQELLKEPASSYRSQSGEQGELSSRSGRASKVAAANLEKVINPPFAAAISSSIHPFPS